MSCKLISSLIHNVHLFFIEHCDNMLHNNSTELLESKSNEIKDRFSPLVERMRKCRQSGIEISGSNQAPLMFLTKQEEYPLECPVNIVRTIYIYLKCHMEKNIDKETLILLDIIHHDYITPDDILMLANVDPDTVNQCSELVKWNNSIINWLLTEMNLFLETQYSHLFIESIITELKLHNIFFICANYAQCHEKGNIETLKLLHSDELLQHFAPLIEKFNNEELFWNMKWLLLRLFTALTRCFVENDTLRATILATVRKRKNTEHQKETTVKKKKTSVKQKLK